MNTVDHLISDVAGRFAKIDPTGLDVRGGPGDQSDRCFEFPRDANGAADAGYIYRASPGVGAGDLHPRPGRERAEEDFDPLAASEITVTVDRGGRPLIFKRIPSFSNPKLRLSVQFPHFHFYDVRRERVDLTGAENVALPPGQRGFTDVVEPQQGIDHDRAALESSRGSFGGCPSPIFTAGRAATETSSSRFKSGFSSDGRDPRWILNRPRRLSRHPRQGGTVQQAETPARLRRRVTLFQSPGEDHALNCPWHLPLFVTNRHVSYSDG